MGAWCILIWAVVCLSGTLAFLKAVADEAEAAEQRLSQLEEQERLQYRKRQEDLYNCDPQVGEAA